MRSRSVNLLVVWCEWMFKNMEAADFLPQLQAALFTTFIVTLRPSVRSIQDDTW